jgi:hypothetical protein
MKVARPKQKPEYDIDPSVPCYKYIGSKGFLSPEDELIMANTPQSVFYLDESIEPNEDFEPMNELARKKMNEFFDKLDRHAELNAKATGKSFAKRSRNFNGDYDMPSEDGRKIQMVRDGAGVPLMGAKKRGRPKLNKVVQEEVPQTTREEFGNQAGQIPS